MAQEQVSITVAFVVHRLARLMRCVVLVITSLSICSFFPVISIMLYSVRPIFSQDVNEDFSPFFFTRFEGGWLAGSAKKEL